MTWTVKDQNGVREIDGEHVKKELQNMKITSIQARLTNPGGILRSLWMEYMRAYKNGTSSYGVMIPVTLVKGSVKRHWFGKGKKIEALYHIHLPNGTVNSFQIKITHATGPIHQSSDVLEIIRLLIQLAESGVSAPDSMFQQFEALAVPLIGKN